MTLSRWRWQSKIRMLKVLAEQSESSSIPEAENQIRQIVQHYFEGLHFANTGLLRTLFSEDCVLKAPGIRRDLNQWLARVEDRPVPAETGATFDYQILSLEIIGEQAMAKVLCPLLDDVFIDFLGLLREDGQWRIVNKMYADKP